MSVRLILYDLDGTLVDSREDLANAVNRTLEDLGHARRPNEELYGFVGNGVRMLLARAVGMEREDLLADALTIFRGHYLGHLTDHTTLYPGVERVLEAFGGLSQAIVTNKPMVYAEGVVRNLRLDERVDLVVGGDSTPALKPDPAMLWAAMEHFDVPPEDTVMVGDGVPDVAAARAAGVRSVLLTSGMGDVRKAMALRPDFQIDHMEQLIPLLDGLGDIRRAAGPVAG